MRYFIEIFFIVLVINNVLKSQNLEIYISNNGIDTGYAKIIHGKLQHVFPTKYSNPIPILNNYVIGMINTSDEHEESKSEAVLFFNEKPKPIYSGSHIKRQIKLDKENFPIKFKVNNKFFILDKLSWKDTKINLKIDSSYLFSENFIPDLELMDTLSSEYKFNNSDSVLICVIPFDVKISNRTKIYLQNLEIIKKNNSNCKINLVFVNLNKNLENNLSLLLNNIVNKSDRTLIKYDDQLTNLPYVVRPSCLFYVNNILIDAYITPEEILKL